MSVFFKDLTFSNPVASYTPGYFKDCLTSNPPTDFLPKSLTSSNTPVDNIFIIPFKAVDVSVTVTNFSSTTTGDPTQATNTLMPCSDGFNLPIANYR